MKTKIYIGLLSLLSVNIFAQDKQEKTVEPFTGLTTSGAVNVKYRNSDTNMVILKGTVEDFGKIDFYSKDNTLFITSHGNISNPLTVYVSGNKLKDVDAAGASTVRSTDVIKATEFHVSSSGASNVHFNLNSNKIDVVATGASDVNLKGNTRYLNVVATGAANLKAYDLITDTCEVNASGASNAKVFVQQKININATGASNVKFKGDPKSVSAEGSSASKIMKISGDGTSSGTPGDTSKSQTKFSWKNKEIIILNNDSHNSYGYYHSDLTRKHWQGLWLGFGGYTNPSVGFTMNTPYKYMALDYGRSFNFQWNLAQRNLNLYKKYIQLSTGIGFQFSNVKFENNTKLNADSSFTWGYVDSSNTFSYQKNRFKQGYVTVPLLLNFNTSKSLKRNFHVSMGVVGKYLLTSRVKQVLLQNNNEFTFIRKDDFNINPFQFDGYASIGYRNFTVYGQYALTELFKKNKGPQVYPFAAGIRITPFE
ncbi:MAG: DUF2807 domain-containing protein [Bacteroidota bacterium]|nr:DUF2807 domain-containing protein [Bacteroidota bacterium]